jgi:hopanoid biosynthesis associated protein HpnK
MQTRLIINADDFGSSRAVNSAVLKSHERGVLTAASLMVTGDASDEAIEIARTHPELAVGLHLTLTMGRSVLPSKEIPSIVDDRSHFTSNPAAAGFKYFFSASARRQLKSEIEAQFEAFAKTGLPFSHVDGHQHLHVHPAIFPTVIDLCRRYRIPGVRIPREPLGANLRIDRSGLADKLIVSFGHRLMSDTALRSVGRSDIAVCDAVVGGMMSGRMSEEYVTGILSKTHGESLEVFFHPADSECEDYEKDRFGPNSDDLRTLLSPTFKAFLLDRGYELSNYRKLSCDFTEEIRATD